MIRISKKADYAVFAMSYLARRAAHAERAQQGAAEPTTRDVPLVSAQEIANVSSLNKSVVANLLKDLGRAGLLDSVRGVRGGYRLARPAREISLAQILAVVDGPLSIVDCAQALLRDGDDSPNAGAGSSTGDAPSQRDAVGPPREPGGPPRELGEPGREAHGKNGANGAVVDVVKAHEDGCCNLASFCPSKLPMQVLNERVHRLLDDLRLDELSGLRGSQLPCADALRFDGANSSRALLNLPVSPSANKTTVIER
jgi:Rrf2 family protein